MAKSSAPGWPPLTWNTPASGIRVGWKKYTGVMHAPALTI